MYNAKQKNAYIAHITTSASNALNLEHIFNVTEPYEMECGLDLSLMSADQIKHVLCMFKSHSYHTEVNRRRDIQNYFEWCKSAGIQTSGVDVSSLTIDKTEYIKTNYYSSPDDLLRTLNEIYDPIDNKTQSVLFRGYFWLAFIGIPYESACSISSNDVDFQDNTIVYSFSEYDIPAEALEDIRMCAELTYINKLVLGKPKREDRIDGDGLLRSWSSNDDVDKFSRTVDSATRYWKSRSGVDRKLSYTNVYLSGQFYRMYHSELSGIPVDVTAFVKEIIVSKRKQVTRGIVSKMRQRYQNDYYEWKRAFGLK